MYIEIVITPYRENIAQRNVSVGFISFCKMKKEKKIAVPLNFARI
jgi:hypothetical protein